MSLMEWSEKYSVGIGALDAQHRQLFAMLNDLHDAMQAGTGSELVGTVLERLIAYTHEHFATEEALFRAHGWPEQGAHRAEHARLTERARSLQRRLDEGEPGVASETQRFLADWLRSHIVASDFGYVAFLKEKGVE